MEIPKKIAQYVENNLQWKEELVILRNLMLATGAVETIKWGIPVYVVNGKNIAGIAAFKNNVSLWFYQGALLKDEAQKLVNAGEGRTKALRQWRFEKAGDIDKTIVARYIKEAVKNAQEGKEIKPEKKEAVSIPEELQNALKKDEKLQASFDSLPPYKQREYAEYINSARREATKVSRLDKTLSLITAGKGLHDKYRS